MQPDSQAQTETPAVDDELAIFSFTEADGEDSQEGEGSEGAANAEEGGEQKPDGVPEGFVLDAESSGIPESYHEGLGKLAGKHGIGGKEAAAFLKDALAFAGEQEEAANKEIGAQLRQEWGAQFEARTKATQTFMARMARKAGIPIENMRVLMSPYGFKLMNAVREYCGEGGKLAGKMGAQSPRQTPQQRLDAIYANPADYEALVHPGHPRHAEVNAEVNRLLGITP